MKPIKSCVLCIVKVVEMFALWVGFVFNFVNNYFNYRLHWVLLEVEL